MYVVHYLKLSLTQIEETQHVSRTVVKLLCICL